MGYENELREEGKYTEEEIRSKISETRKELAGMTLNKLKEDNRYKKLNIEECTQLKQELEKFEKGKKGHIKYVEKRITNLEKEYNKNKHKKDLEIDESQLSNFECVLRFPKLKQELINVMGEDMAQALIKELEIVYDIAITALKSKQCNEPFESLLSNVLGVFNMDDKHGFDAVDCIEKLQEVFEYKPSSKTNNPCGTINDDSEEKIKKCEDLKNKDQIGWLILAGIDKENYTFNKIYKFPLEIYNEDRRTYFSNLKENNKENNKQTRSTYSINIEKSIELCNEFNLDYYVWER